MNCNEMGGLAESVYDNPDRVFLSGCKGQTHNEVHTNVIPLPHGYQQRLDYSSRFQMACFHPVASVTLGYVLGYIDFHVGPPVILFHVLVHLGTVGMNREFGHMSLIKDCLLNICIDRHHKAFSKSDHILVIPLETRILRISLC
jgi:hypothetical protein